MPNSPTQSDIIVTGATGTVGAEVVKCLLRLGQQVSVADRYPERIGQRFDAGVEPVLFDFAAPETFRDALRGKHAMFLMRPPQITNMKKMLFPVIDAARAAGVRRVVFLSLIGVEHHKVTPHYPVEQYLRSSGLAYTFLRCGFFMQNLNTALCAEIRDHDEIFVPVGSGRTSFIDARDIGAVATAALLQPGHENKAYDLTGAEALDYDQVAALLTQVLGRRISYRSPSAFSYFVRQLRQHAPLPYAVVTTWLYTNTRKGMADAVTDQVERLLGRRPISMRKYIEDYRASWSRSTAKLTRVTGSAG
jgi:uncharacterized protein YbjT (DUF2867 family)